MPAIRVGKVVQPVSVQEQQAIAPVPRVLGAVLRNSMFQYAVNFTFAGAENQQTTIQIQTDAHFIVVMSVFSTNVAAGVPGAAFGGCLVQLSDLASNRSLSNIPVAVASLFGTAERPFVWPFTHLFRAGGGINLSVTGIAAATAQIVRLVFAGYKIPVGSVPQAGL